MLNHLGETSEEYYSRAWEESSLTYEQRGYYNWCIEKIESCSRVLEVGTGIGICTEKLIKQDFAVTSIESNVHNYRKAIKRLKMANFSIDLIDAKKHNENHLKDDNLVFGDFIVDGEIHEKILTHVEFDGIICWFMGVHPLAHLSPGLRRFGYVERMPATYRDLVYDKIFKETSQLLPSNGLISLIERTEFFESEELVKEHIAKFTDYYELERYGLEIEAYDQLRIEDIRSVAGIEMEAFDGDQKVSDDANITFALTSISIVKT